MNFMQIHYEDKT